ncbi:MAG: hypothetical protein WEB58_22440 [Planctomycetaceae bacterium]
MARTVLGIVAAQIVLYLWGFLVWGLGPYREAIWKKPTDDDAAQQSLLTYFPTEGTYFVPSAQEDGEKMEKLYKDGPLVMVHVLSIRGKPVADMSVMINGFFWNLLVIVLIAIWMKRYAHAFPTYGERFGFVAFAGVIAAVLIDGGGVAWWRMDIPWKIYQGLYDVSVWVIAGAILAACIKPSSSVPRTSETPASPPI